jgi:pilus assembly protein CpaE
VPVVLIAPNEKGRQEIVKALSDTDGRIVREFNDYPGMAAVCSLLSEGCGIVIIDLDAGVAQGLDLIESISKCGIPATVIACSGRSEADIVIRAMRAGAREFLAAPVSAAAFTEAFDRAAARQRAVSPERSAGKVFVFQGTKGGVGATTLATNFAVAIAREDAGRVVLVDMHPQLGEIALGLGLAPQFSIGDALGNAVRLDADFLSTLLVRHSSGLMVLASPDAYGVNRSLERGADKLLRILREEFAWVVVDAGPSCANITDALFEMADRIYLVTEASLPALRNARRLISYLAGKERSACVEVLMNRVNSRLVEIDEASAVKALGHHVDWKVPSDYVAVRSAQNAGVPLVNHESPLARMICQMTRAAMGIPASAPKKPAAAESAGEKWKFWTSNSTRPLSTAHS